MMFRFSGGKKEVAAVVEEKSVEKEIEKKDHHKPAKSHDSPRYECWQLDTVGRVDMT